jgi:hypothetical protein
MTAPFRAMRAKALGWGYLNTIDNSHASDIPQGNGSIRQADVRGIRRRRDRNSFESGALGEDVAFLEQEATCSERRRSRLRKGRRGAAINLTSNCRSRRRRDLTRARTLEVIAAGETAEGVTLVDYTVESGPHSVNDHPDACP